MSDWQQPEVGGAGTTKSDFYDFWVEGYTHGAKGTVHLNGSLLKGVTAVKTEMGIDAATTVTITFIARTLNKGTRPDG